MIGYSYIIDPVKGQQPVHMYYQPLPLDVIQNAVGGNIEIVPMFKTAFVDGNIINNSDAIAFCNEEGKITGLTYNKFAQDQWYNALAVQTGKQVPDVMLDIQDVLVGPVLVAWGDEEFMRSM